MKVRQLAEHMSRNVVLRRRLPSSFRRLPIYVTPEASLRYWLPMPKVDPLLYRMARELVKPGDVVWDVGANVGLFSLCAATLAGSKGFVLAIEPDRQLARLIRQTFLKLDRNSDTAPAAILHKAISSQNGESVLRIANRSRAANYLENAGGSAQAGGYRSRQLVHACTLDYLLGRFPIPSLLKIDVETHELEVLKGASDVLTVARPIIWCEVAPENARAVATVLGARDYNLYAAATLPPRAALTDRASWDTLAIPQERDSNSLPA